MKFLWFLLFLCICLIILLELNKPEIKQEAEKIKIQHTPSKSLWWIKWESRYYYFLPSLVRKIKPDNAE